MRGDEDTNMMLTSEKLAQNVTFPAVALCMCAQCNYVAKFSELTNVQGSCQKCGERITPRIFPSLSAKEFLKMIDYFYAKACDRHYDSKSQLQHVLREEIGQTYDIQLLIKTVKEIQEFYQRGNQSEDGKMLEIVRECLSLQSQEEAGKVFIPLLTYSDSFEEHKSVVVLTCTLLENLFCDLLILIYVCKGFKKDKVEKWVRDESRSFHKRCDIFGFA